MKKVFSLKCLYLWIIIIAAIVDQVMSHEFLILWYCPVFEGKFACVMCDGKNLRLMCIVLHHNTVRSVVAALSVWKTELHVPCSIFHVAVWGSFICLKNWVTCPVFDFPSCVGGSFICLKNWVACPVFDFPSCVWGSFICLQNWVTCLVFYFLAVWGAALSVWKTELHVPCLIFLAVWGAALSVCKTELHVPCSIF